ncbi:MAG: hypothetical protein Q8Q80_01430 [Methyloversatilis sp.]|uniref:hypothetical protein n=1 Tax=Methyloversatilis sp. TaxID=2569862 RepID=UPI002733E6F2|nr:hypothetical protein [Methyloversatilis sp.]MDP3871299.1 hypothetical protein [Methyloversatilis sp.]
MSGIDRFGRDYSPPTPEYGASLLEAVSARSSGWTDTVFGRLLHVRENEQIDVALRACIADLRSTAILNGGRVPAIIVKGQRYGLGSQSGLSAMVTLEPFVELRFVGTTYIDCAGKTVPIFWVRNDITPEINYGPESDSNNKKIIGGSSLILSCQSQAWLAGSVAIRWGNGDGVWGTNFTGLNKYYNAFMEVENLHMQFFDHSIEFTNNGSFCSRWTNVWSSNPNWSIVTSSSAAEKDSYEMHSFIRFFSANTNQGHIQCNSGGARDHQLSFLHSSLTFTAGTVVELNTAAQCRVEISSSRIENFAKATDAKVATPRSWVRLNNLTMIPSNSLGGPLESPTIRPIFRGLAHNVQCCDVRWNIVSIVAWSNDSYNDAARQFIADDDVVVTMSDSYADDPPGSITTNNSMRLQPINKAQVLNRNWNFEEATLAGWTAGGTGSITLTTAANEFYGGVRGVKVTNVGQHSNLLCEPIPVTPGRFVYGNAVMRYSDTSTDNLPNVTFEVIFYRADGTTVISNSIVSTPVTQHNWWNRRSATRFLQSSIGTGLVRVPIAARFAAMKMYWHGNGPVTTPTTGVYCLDNAPFFSL